ncbi:MAG TPA: hypothetical protein VN973_05985 [Candidatus Dormibacteraeota bacterium]|nr:hypothetical protein [Candidatus Dormibacteraeota bacterium]
MPDPITIFVGAVLGWLLKTLADKWTWRRQQVLDAYVGLLEALDRSSVPMGQLWTSGKDMAKRDEEWIALAERVRQHLVEIDHAQGKLALVAGQRGADAAFELYFASDREFRRAIAVPPSTSDHYREASLQTAKAYFDVVYQGRREMWLRHWRELLPGRESTFEKHDRRFAELDRTDPYPVVKKPEQRPDESSTS